MISYSRTFVDLIINWELVKDRYSGSIRESESGVGRVELTNLKV